MKQMHLKYLRKSLKFSHERIKVERRGIMKKNKRMNYGITSLSILLIGLGLIILCVPLVENIDKLKDSSLIIISSILLIVGSALAGYTLLTDGKNK